jgi:hypothetical protein
MYRVPLPKGGYRFEYRKNQRFEVVLLVEMKGEADTCRDSIVAALELPAHGDEEAIDFECAPLKRAQEGIFIGIIPNASRSAVATPAWRLDLGQKKFHLVPGQSIVCTNTPADP